MREQKLEQVKSLGDRVIFLGLSQPFILSACDFPGLRPNSIYFTDDCSQTIYFEVYPYGSHDLGIYHLEDNSIEPCYPFPDELQKNNKVQPPLLWVAPSAKC